MIRQASFFAAAAFALLVATGAQAQSGAPAVTPANCKAPVLPKQPAQGMKPDELNGLTKQYQAAVKDGNARYMQCASDADWNKFQKSVTEYGNKLNAEISAFNKTGGRPATTPASCTPMKRIEIPDHPSREQLVQLQSDIKTAQADFPRFAQCASQKDAMEAKANFEKAVDTFNGKAKSFNEETERTNAQTRQQNEEALKQQEEAAKQQQQDKQRNNSPMSSGSNSPGTRY